MTSDRHQVRNHLLTAFCILLISALMIVFNGGISVGTSNHAGLLPVVRRILDSSYLPGDFGIAVRFYHHRVFAYLVAGFSALVGEDLALILLSAIGMALLSGALFVLCRSLTLSRMGFVAAGMFVATKLAWTGLGLELNNFAGDPEATPPAFAHSFLLLGTASLLSGRYLLTALFAGLTLLFHLQIGLIFALVLLPFFVIRLKAVNPRIWAAMALLFLTAAALALLHLVQMIRAGLIGSSFTLDYINFRHPHHFELLSAAAGLWVGAHLVLQLGCYYWLRGAERPEARGVRLLLTMSLLIAGLSLVHFLDYYVLHFGFVAKIQLLRLSPLITVFGAVSMVVALNASERSRLSSGASGARYVRSANLCLIVLAAVWAGYYLMTRPTDYNFGIRRYIDQKSAWVDVCRWIRNYGPAGTTYLTPPDRGGFTCLTDRSTVVEFKINPDGGLHLHEWQERLRDVCGGALPNARGFANYSPLRKAYASLTREQLVALAAKYDVSAAVLPVSSEVDFETLYQNGDFKVVRIPGE